MKGTGHFAKVIAGITIFLIVAGCGGSTGGHQASGSRAVPGLHMCSVLTPGYYYIGVAFPYTGALAAFAKSLEQSAALAVDEINRSGGVHGHPVGLVRCDTRDEVVTSGDVIRELAHIPVVDGIVGPCASADTLSAAPEVIAAKKVMVSPSATSPKLTLLQDKGFVFRTAMSDDFQGAVMAIVAYEKGIRDVMIVFRNDDYGQGLSATFSKKFKELGGHSDSMAYNDVTFNAGTVANAIQKRSPGAVLLISFVNDGASIIKAATNLGLHVRWLLTDGIKDPSLVDKVGGPAPFKDSFGTAPFLPYGKEHDLFVHAYKTQWGEEPGSFGANTYDATYLVALAMELAKDPDDGTEVRNRMASNTMSGPRVGPGGWSQVLKYVSDGKTAINYDGASGPVDFDKHGDVMSDIELWGVDAQGHIVATGCRKPDGTVCTNGETPNL